MTDQTRKSRFDKGFKSQHAPFTQVSCAKPLDHSQCHTRVRFTCLRHFFLEFLRLPTHFQNIVCTPTFVFSLCLLWKSINLNLKNQLIQILGSNMHDAPKKLKHKVSGLVGFYLSLYVSEFLVMTPFSFKFHSPIRYTIMFKNTLRLSVEFFFNTIK